MQDNGNMKNLGKERIWIEIRAGLLQVKEALAARQLRMSAAESYTDAPDGLVSREAPGPVPVQPSQFLKPRLIYYLLIATPNIFFSRYLGKSRTVVQQMQ